MTAPYTPGRRDVLELDTSELPKVRLANKIKQLIEARGLSQAQAAQILGMSQPKISAIRNYKLRGISLARLLQALADLDQHVEIVVRPSSAGTPPGVTVPA